VIFLALFLYAVGFVSPTMSHGHLLFATVATADVLEALQLEERDLLAYHGETYSAYQRQVRRLVPCTCSLHRTIETG